MSRVQQGMKRSVLILALLALTIFTVACATTATQTIRGTVSSVEAGKLTVTPATGSPVTLTVGGVTRIFKGGVESATTDVLAAGQNVQVFYEGDRATKVLIAAE